jgi:hypothetical protein
MPTTFLDIGIAGPCVTGWGRHVTRLMLVDVTVIDIAISVEQFVELARFRSVRVRPAMLDEVRRSRLCPAGTAAIKIADALKVNGSITAIECAPSPDLPYLA